MAGPEFQAPTTTRTCPLAPTLPLRAPSQPCVKRGWEARRGGGGGGGRERGVRAPGFESRERASQASATHRHNSKESVRRGGGLGVGGQVWAPPRGRGEGQHVSRGEKTGRGPRSGGGARRGAQKWPRDAGASTARVGGDAERSARGGASHKEGGTRKRASARAAQAATSRLPSSLEGAGAVLRRRLAGAARCARLLLPLPQRGERSRGAWGVCSARGSAAHRHKSPARPGGATRRRATVTSGRGAGQGRALGGALGGGSAPLRSEPAIAGATGCTRRGARGQGGGRAGVGGVQERAGEHEARAQRPGGAGRGVGACRARAARRARRARATGAQGPRRAAAKRNLRG